MNLKGLLNDEWILLHEPAFTPVSRAVQFGDGWFETIKVANGKVLFLEEHADRLMRTSKILACTIPPFWNKNYWETRILQVCKENNWNNARIKILIFREASGNYLPDAQNFGWMITGNELQDSAYTLNEHGVVLKTFGQYPKPSEVLSILKTTSAMRYVQAATFAMRNGADEAVLINQEERICEASSSNIFMVQNGLLTTPPLTEYCLDGVMRRVVLKLATELNLDVLEVPFIGFELQNADEVFLTNVIKGIRWVSEFDSMEYTKYQTSALLIEELNKRFVI
jgi:branched-chain amino acid aminotransferase